MYSMDDRVFISNESNDNPDKPPQYELTKQGRERFVSILESNSNKPLREDGSEVGMTTGQAAVLVKSILNTRNPEPGSLIKLPHQTLQATTLAFWLSRFADSLSAPNLTKINNMDAFVDGSGIPLFIDLTEDDFSGDKVSTNLGTEVRRVKTNIKTLAADLISGKMAVVDLIKNPSCLTRKGGMRNAVLTMLGQITVVTPSVAGDPIVFNPEEGKSGGWRRLFGK